MLKKDDNIPATGAAPASPSSDGAPPPSAKPPRGPSTHALVTVLVTFVIALVLGAAFGGRLWHGMSKAWDSIFFRQTSASASPVKQYYTCAMHPWVILPKPGNCPICGMKLVPLDTSKFTGEVKINPVTVQNIGVRVQPVHTGPLIKTIRTVGTVDYAEPLLSDVNTKVGGWIEKLYVNETGQEVKAGQKLFDLYSPELYAAQEEYLLAYRNQPNAGAKTGTGTVFSRGEVGANFVPDAAKNNEELLDSARTKLEYFDITPQQIEALQEAGKPSKTMTIRAPQNGVVIQKHVYAGMKISAGSLLYRIADLSKVWVIATVYQYQLPYVRVGQNALMTLSYLPGEKFQGKVTYIYPYLNEKVHEAKVRLEFENPDSLLKPGMFANVELKNELAKDRVLAPRSAIIDTGTRKVAFVSLGEGRFESRNVRTGIETQDGMVEVLDGLKPGEMVVTSGEFLLDSEARTREALAKMVKANLASNQKPAPEKPAAEKPAAASQSASSSLPRELRSPLRQALEDYLTIGHKLVADSTSGIDAPARQIASAADAMLKTTIPGQPDSWHNQEQAVRDAARKLQSAKDIAAMRQAFAELSSSLGEIVKKTGIPPRLQTPLVQHTCPMGLGPGKAATWLQLAGKVQNPYLGQKWPGCDQPALRVTMPAAH